MQYTINVAVAIWMDEVRGGLSRQSFMTVILREKMKEYNINQRYRDKLQLAYSNMGFKGERDYFLYLSELYNIKEETVGRVAESINFFDDFESLIYALDNLEDWYK